MRELEKRLINQSGFTSRVRNGGKSLNFDVTNKGVSEKKVKL